MTHQGKSLESDDLLQSKSSTMAVCGSSGGCEVERGPLWTGVSVVRVKEGGAALRGLPSASVQRGKW